MPDDVMQKLRTPSICLIVLGVINGSIAVIYAVVWLMSIALAQGDPAFATEAEQTGYYLGRSSALLFSLVCIGTSPVIAYGGFQMSKARNYTLCKIAAILAAIPCTSACFVAGIPLGIWAIVVLNRPDVKLLFQNNAHQVP